MEIDIYTDCGGSNSDLGIGIHIIDKHEIETSYMMRTHTKDVNKIYNINNPLSVGEIHAVLTSLSLVTENVKKVRIFTDSEHSYIVFNKLYTKNNNPKKIKLGIIYDNFNIALDVFKSKFEVEVMWIKGHVGVYGNEISDAISRKALKKSVIPNQLFKIETPKKGEPVKFL